MAGWEVAEGRGFECSYLRNSCFYALGEAQPHLTCMKYVYTNKRLSEVKSVNNTYR